MTPASTSEDLRMSVQPRGRATARALFLCLSAAIAAGCAGFDPNVEPKYESSRERPNLEIPPELSAPELDSTYTIPPAGGRVSAREMDEPGRRGGALVVEGGVLPSYEGVKVRRDGAVRWLEVGQPPEVLWPRLREFWRVQGLTLKIDNPTIGLMQTDWAENRAGLTEDSFRRFLGRIYDAGTRDRYRLRVERTDEGGSAIFLTHQGAEEDDAGDDPVIVKWRIRPSDPELEAVMSARLMVFLGEQEEVAQRVVEEAVEARGASVAAVRLETIDGEPTLTYGERFSRAWIRVSIALDRLGMIVDEFNRSEGRFYFTYVPREETQGSFFGNLFGGGDPLEEGEQYQVQVEDLDAEVQIRALDKDGNTLPFDEAEEILKRLEDQLK